MFQAKLIFESDLASVGSIPVGIHEGVTFSGLVKDGDSIDITFIDTEKRFARKRLFKPTGAMPFEKADKVMETPAEALEREQHRNVVALTYVLSVVGDEASIDKLTAKTYTEFAEKAITITNGFKGTKVNLKVVPKVTKKKEGGTTVYANIPAYNGYMELYTEGVPSTLNFSQKELKDIASSNSDGKKEEAPDHPF
jgi:hypothetical protein